MGIQSYRDLIVWQKALSFVEEIYRTTQSFPNHELYGLTNQIRRSAVSVPSNIAEGQARQHSKEFKQFLFVAKGSLAEAHPQLLIANRLDCLSSEALDDLNKQVDELQKMLHTLIHKLPTTH